MPAHHQFYKLHAQNLKSLKILQLTEANIRQSSGRHCCPSLGPAFLCVSEGDSRESAPWTSHHTRLCVWGGGGGGVMFISAVKMPAGISRHGVSERKWGGGWGVRSYGNWPVCSNCSSGVGLWSELFKTAAGLVLDNCLNDLHGARGCVTTELILGQPADLTESSSLCQSHPPRPKQQPIFHSVSSVY